MTTDNVLFAIREALRSRDERVYRYADPPTDSDAQFVSDVRAILESKGRL